MASVVPPPSDPLVLTLRLDAAAQAFFDRQRRALFPPGRTAVGAHVTLFHALPGDLAAELSARLAAAAAATAPFPVEVAGVRPLGRGTAYELVAPPLAALRDGLVEDLRGRLTRQDAQPYRPHVTVENKVAPAVARATLARLRAGFAPWTAQAEGLALWRYAGGPWEPLGTYAFAGREPPGSG